MTASPPLDGSAAGAATAFPHAAGSPGPERVDPVEPPTWLELGGLAVVVAVAAVALLSLLTAWAGVHDGVVVLLAGLGLTVALAALLVRRASWTPAPWSWAPAAALVAVLVVAATQFFPGFPLAAKNRDPGVFVNHAVAVARDGSTTIEDPVFATGAEVVVVDGEARIVTDEGNVAWRKLPYRSFPTDEDDPEHILPDFFHLWPTSLATAHDLAGRAGLFNLTPLLALGAVGLLFLATRRTFGLLAATVAAGLLAVNELEVWQAKFPTAESLSQLIYTGALLAVALTLTTRWRVAAVVGGALVGIGFVARPEGVFVVGLAAAVLALLWALRDVDGSSADASSLRPPGLALPFAAGMVPPLLLGAYQAYGRDSRYAKLQDGLPSFREAVAGVVLLALAAVALRLVCTRAPGLVDRVRKLDRDRVVPMLGLALTGLFLLFLVVAWFRPELFGENYRIDKAGDRTRGYDELNLRRLTLFVTPLALVAAVGALVVGVRRQWRWVRWALILPGLIVAPVLIWEPRIAPNLMWWGRRYVPVVVPTLLVLVGVAAALLWERRGGRQTLVRVATAVLVLAMAGYMVRQSNDLWGHEEFGGSLGVIDQLEEVAAGEDVVFVWQGQSTQAANFAVAPFTWLGLPGLTGPPRPTAAGLLALQRALGDRPLFLVTDGDEPPPEAASVLEEERRIVTELSTFEQTNEARPTQSLRIPVDLTVWRLVTSPDAARSP